MPLSSSDSYPAAFLLLGTCRLLLFSTRSNRSRRSRSPGRGRRGTSSNGVAGSIAVRQSRARGLLGVGEKSVRWSKRPRFGAL